MSAGRSRGGLALTALLMVLGVQTLHAAEARAQSADLAITKTDGVTSVTPGGSVTYTITASNAGPSLAPDASVVDTFPAVLTGTWTCVGRGGGTCTAAGSGNIDDNVDLPAGGSVTYTVSATISAAATGTLTNTATVTAPGDVTDPDPSNNSARDIDTLTPSADLAVTKTDGVTSATPGGSVTYTITASNAGPSYAAGASVVDTLPAVLTGTWTCVGAGGGTCTASGSGNINDTVNLPDGGSVTYTVSATISAAATGNLSNTATVTAPSGATDPDPANNSATDTDTLPMSADLAITKTDGVTSATPGDSVTYTITASNAGPSSALGASVVDVLPAVLTGTWTCVGAGGGTCTASGSGNIDDTVDLPAGGSVTYTVSATISAAATGSLSNTATVTAPAGVNDPDPANSATDTDTLTPPELPVVVEPPVVVPPPVVVAPPVVVTTQCTSLRHFTIRLIERRGRLIRSARVFVRGRRVAVVRRRSDRRLVAVVDLRGLPRGTYRVVLEARLRNGNRARWVRSYRTCIEPLPASNRLDNPRAL